MKYFAILFIIVLTGCVDLGTTRTDGSLGRLATLTAKDLKTAEVMAIAANDKVASLCYRELANYVGSKKVIVVPDGAGVFTVFQAARSIRRDRDKGIPDTINTRCAPLIVDAGKTLFKLRRLVGAPL